MERRRRFSRSRNNGPHYLTRQDIEILILLSRYRYLRRTFITELTGRGVAEVNANLRKLFDNGYVNKPREQLRGYNNLYAPDIYELDRKGADTLTERLPEITRLIRRKVDGPIRNFAHSMMICDALGSLEAGLHRSDCQLITWQEVVARCDATEPMKLPCSVTHTFPTGKTERASTSIVPDGLFGVRYPGGKVSFFVLEAEHYNPIEPTTLNRASFLKKLLGYRDIVQTQVYKKQLNIPNMRVLVVAPTAERVRHMVELTERITGGSNLFLFQDIPVQEELLKAPPPFPQLFTSEWLRAGREPARIDTV